MPARSLGRMTIEALMDLRDQVAAQLGPRESCLEISARQVSLATHAPAVMDSPAGREMAKRHEMWAKRLPEERSELWEFVAGLSDSERLQLLAHCASLTVNAVRAPG